MSKTATTVRWTTLALFAGILALPGLALAHDHDGDGDWDGRHERHHHAGHGHWRGHGQGHRYHDRDVVVIREPVYVAPRPTLVAPLWSPAGIGINLVFHGQW